MWVPDRTVRKTPSRNERMVVGFWGEYVVARGDRPLPDLEPFNAGVCREDHDYCIGDPVVHGGGWQTVVVHHGLPGNRAQTLQALATRTGHPALAVYICDSDTGYVEGWSSRNGLFASWFRPRFAAEYEVPHDVCFEDETGMPSTAYRAAWDAAHARIVTAMPRVARDACAWARASGWRPDPEKVLGNLLDDSDGFAEHRFFELLHAMGLPTVGNEGRAS